MFPSLTDTFGVVQLEALACGTPVAAFPVTGPLDVIADHPVGALDTDLRSACIRALGMSREACRNFALERSWENSARQFIGNLTALQPSRSLRPARRVASRTRGARLIESPATANENHHGRNHQTGRARHSWISTARWSSAPMTAGRRSTISCSAACSARAGTPAILATNKHRRPRARGRRRHRHLVAAICAEPAHLRHRYFGRRCCARRRRASPNCA